MKDEKLQRCWFRLLVVNVIHYPHWDNSVDDYFINEDITQIGLFAKSPDHTERLVLPNQLQRSILSRYTKNVCTQIMILDATRFPPSLRNFMVTSLILSTMVVSLQARESKDKILLSHAFLRE